MAEGILALVIVGLLVDRWLLVRAHDRDEERQGSRDGLLITAIDRIHERAQEQVSEMAERIQHPEVFRPDITGDETEEFPEPVYDDEYDLVGKIIEEEQEDVNGGHG